jgi:hypothetical protein
MTSASFDPNAGASNPNAQSGGESAKVAADVLQDDAIRQLRRKISFAWASALFGPALALAGVAVAWQQWRAADNQVQLMRDQLADARKGADAARDDTDRALRHAENQALSLRTLALAATISAEAERRQSRVMERQVRLSEVQLNDMRSSSAESMKIVTDQLLVAESQAQSLRSLAAATEDSAQAAKLSSAHAERTVDILKETLHVQERAWVQFADLRERQFYIPLLLPYKVTFKFNNVGRSPALNVRAALVREQSDRPHRDVTYSGYAEAGDIGPGGKFYITPPLFVHPLSEYATGTRTAYVHGYITYDDIFGASHRLNICYARRWGGSWGVCDEDSGSSAQEER